ncbi:unnamed protein product [Symbiodinium sp. CCMP2456]|nr:unnamed protein product [Symbiodinium sp. CCMP2456]
MEGQPSPRASFLGYKPGLLESSRSQGLREQRSRCSAGTGQDQGFQERVGPRTAGLIPPFWRRRRQRERRGRRDRPGEPGSGQQQSGAGPRCTFEGAKSGGAQEEEAGDQRAGSAGRGFGQRPKCFGDAAIGLISYGCEEGQRKQGQGQLTPWWLFLRQRKRRGRLQQVWNEGRGFAEQAARQDQEPPRQDLPRVRAGDRGGHGNRGGTGLDDSGLPQEAGLGEVQGHLPVCGHGCSSLRNVAGRRDRERHRTASAEHESKTAGCDVRGRLGSGVALDRISRSSKPPRVRGQQRGDGGGERLPRGAQQAQEESPRGRPEQPWRRGGRRGWQEPPKVNLDLELHGAGKVLHSVDPALSGRNSTRFMKYFAWLERAHGYLLERSSADTPLFPSALPYPEVCGLRLGAKGFLDSAEWCRAFVNALVAWCNYVVLGCPDGAGSAYEPRVAHRSVEGIRPYADKLLGEVAEFFCPEMLSGTLSCEGKRKDLEELVASGTGACYSGVVKVGCEKFSSALPEAGQVDPRQCLDSSRAEVLDRLSDLRLPEALWGEEVVACHRVAVQEETPLLRRLLAAQMITFVPEQELPRRRDGRLLLGGLFAVRKNEDEDRLIFDRRPENATMTRLDWAKLPAGACFCRMILGEKEILRGSGDDLRNYYYTLALPLEWVRFNGFGRRVEPKLLAEATHEAVLRREGLLDKGAYLDDLLVTYRLALAQKVALDGSFQAPAPLPQDPDVVLVKAAERAYHQANLSRAEHKAFRCETNFKAWGAEVDGVQGRAGAPLDVRRQVWQILRKIVDLGFCTKEILQRLLGFVCFIFQYRREFYSLQHHIYRYMEGMKIDRWVRLPNHIIDELRSMAFHLPFAFWSMRRELGRDLVATDATPTAGGATAAQISGDLARELWRRSEVAPRWMRTYDVPGPRLWGLEVHTGQRGFQRTRECPEGDECLPHVKWANDLWRRAVHLANIARKAGVFFAIVNPANSRAWSMPETQQLVCRDGVSVCKVDWSAYQPEGGGTTHAKRVMKVCFTLPWLDGRGLKTGSGQGQQACGGRGQRAQGRGRIPKEFCADLAGALHRWEHGAPAPGCCAGERI